ncbi:polyketide synthase dehydratase domain-containing protein, partial [Nocardia sp. NPDC050697]|uniref:polyketide synthase dehydratase domain-containing protein n=1 Tax=Nocardia sp. NPDC050697 TaxID=3155158 RepID=UPI0033F1AC50
MPTYAFQHRRYWLEAGSGSGDAVSLGLAAADHPLVGAVVSSPETGGVTVSGRLSLAAQPWLADHAVGGVVLFPGTGFVELVIRAGDEVGCAVLRELTLFTPLVVPAAGAVQVQVIVGDTLHSTGADTGERAVSVYSRPESLERAENSGVEWVLHAQGVLAPAPVTTPAPEPGPEWPPVGAVSIDIAGLYEQLTDTGYGYGPTFQGLQAVWRRGEDLFVQATLPDTVTDAHRYGLHPALLDAVLHGLAFAGGDSGQPMLPFAWEEVTLHAAGATTVRARLSTTGTAVTLAVTDGHDQPVITVQALTMRPVHLDQLAATTPVEGLLGVHWPTLTTPAAPRTLTHLPWQDLTGEHELPTPEVVVFDTRPLHTTPDTVPGAEVVRAVHTVLADTLTVLQDWAGQDRFRDTRLLIVTSGAVPAGGQQVSDLTGAAVWGLVRSAQTEDPGRIVLTDLDPGQTVDTTLVSTITATGEPQLAVRAGT